MLQKKQTNIKMYSENILLIISHVREASKFPVHNILVNNFHVLRKYSWNCVCKNATKNRDVSGQTWSSILICRMWSGETKNWRPDYNSLFCYDLWQETWKTVERMFDGILPNVLPSILYAMLELTFISFYIFFRYY